MNPMKRTLSILALSAASAGATVTINGEFGQLRNSSGDPIISTTTLWVLIVDTNNDDALPGGLGLNSSLDAGSDSIQAFADFNGLTINEGMNIGGDKVVKYGTFNDPDGVAVFSVNFNLTTLGLTAGQSYGFYWFPGVNTVTRLIPDTDFQIGGINEEAAYTGAGDGSKLGTVLPADGKLVATAVGDEYVGGNLTAASGRFSAIDATAIPEAGSFTLGLLGLAGLLRRNRK